MKRFNAGCTCLLKLTRGQTCHNISLSPPLLSKHSIVGSLGQVSTSICIRLQLSPPTHFTPTIPSKNLSDPGPVIVQPLWDLWGKFQQVLPSHSTPGYTRQSNICICNKLHKLQEKMCTCNIFQLRVCFVPNPLSWSVT